MSSARSSIKLNETTLVGFVSCAPWPVPRAPLAATMLLAVAKNILKTRSLGQPSYDELHSRPGSGVTRCWLPEDASKRTWWRGDGAVGLWGFGTRCANQLRGTCPLWDALVLITRRKVGIVLCAALRRSLVSKHSKWTAAGQGASDSSAAFASITWLVKVLPTH